MITVIIPTTNRPNYLRTALESVQRQTALARITEILVSENAGDRTSENVCKEFPTLPIRYIFRDPPVDGLQHGDLLIREATNQFIAILHDDDWWSQHHLAAAMELLDSQPNVVATFSHLFETFDPSGFFQVPPRLWLLWVAVGRSFRRPHQVLTAEQVLLGGLLMSCFHFSTLVARAGPLRAASAKVVESGNDYDIDRLYGPFLGEFGSVGYLTEPHTFVRIHPNQDGRRPAMMTTSADGLPRWMVRMKETTRDLRARYPETMSRAAALFNSSLAELPREQAEWISSLIPAPIRSLLEGECGFRLSVPKLSGIRAVVRQCCPPILLNPIRGVMRVVAGSRQM